MSTTKPIAVPHNGMSILAADNLPTARPDIATDTVRGREVCPHCGQTFSRQVVWGRRMRAEGHCVSCGDPAVPGRSRCAGCQERVNSRQKARRAAEKEARTQRAVGDGIRSDVNATASSVAELHLPDGDG